MDGVGKEVTQPKEKERPEVRAFKEEISKADGTLLPLKKTTVDGKRIYIAARRLTHPFNLDQEDPATNPNFWGWEDRSPLYMTDVLLVDAYAESDGKIVPLGHMDWWIQEDYANGGGNMHQALRPQQPYEQESTKKWRGDTAFQVDYDYHRQGLGSLLLASSGVALSGIDVKKFYSGVLLEPAQKTYQRFGITEDDFPRSLYKPLERYLPIERLTQNPITNKTISEFV